jgi:hypothetical protein
MAFFGAGTRSSPIAFVDSEDEAHELYKDSSSSSLSVSLEKPPLSLPPQPPKPRVWTESASILPSCHHFFISFLSLKGHQPQPQQWDGKRKRTHSFASHDGPMVGPSVPQRSYTTLENRLSQPESKKARKRRRKAERQALEDARIQNFNYGPSPFTSGVPILPFRSWSSDVQMFGGYLPPHYTDQASLMQSGLITGFTPPFTFTVLPEPDDLTLYDNREPYSVSPPPPPSHWVSSMAKAASDPIDLTKTEEHNELSQWSPLSTQKNLPPSLPSSLLPPLPPHITHSNNSRLNLSTPIEHHALPPKPPPLQTTIGMKPDQDPNSKHGIFQLSSATKEAGTDVKKKGPLYMPNPARTLVMEQLPKSHRNPDFINSWSKRACSVLPVHMFIDGPGGKALIEFATAELARKAWASPKLASTHAHQVKGKPREDLIKVWWYRVDGVGAGSGVGEIEEGEIEGDAIEKEVDQPFKKETKKEKKARLAKEREEKRVKRELELRLIKQRHASLRVELPTSSTRSSAVPENSYQRGITPVSLSPSWPVPEYPSVSPPWSPIIAQAQYLPMASDPGNRSLMEWGRNNWVEHPGPSAWFTLDDYECNMDVDVPQLPLPHPTVQPGVQTLPLHSSLPPRPASTIVAPHPRVAAPPPPLPPPTNVLPSSQPIYEVPPPPPAAPSPPPTSGSSSSTPSPRTPSEPRAMKNAPTEPSYTKRALMARQKELEEKIAKSKLELAETRAATGSTTKPATPVSSLQPADDPAPVKPSMDLGEKQAMEDRLRKLVLQSQIAKGKAGVAVLSVDNSNVSAPSTAGSPSISASSSLSSSSSSAPSPVVPSDQLPLSQLTTVSLSAHNFSLEDLAVSFITQTIETIKSKPTLTPIQTPTAISIDPSNKPTIQSNNKTNMKLELAAKQRRLEQHITESKKLMSKLAQARTKEEKDTILKAMREMTRCVTISPIAIYQYHFGFPFSGLPIGLNEIFLGIFPCFFWGVFISFRLFEEGSQPKTTSTKTTTSTSTMKTKTSQSPPPQGPFIKIWPGSHEDAGVLILSDSDSDDSYESDED